MTQSKPSSIRLVGLASLIGTTIEWYDFFLYGTAAALVLDKIFFPTFDPFVGRLAALTTYAVGFVARPLGGIIIGHFGDRIGRKSMLVLTLMIMGIATFLIGVLPTYDQLGPMAAVLLVLLRVAQGFGVGGEWGGAILMAVEHAPPGKRGFYGSWPQIGVPAGLLLSTLVFTPFSRLPQEAFLSWGWRIPFLISLLLVVVGLIIRVRIIETPAFSKMKEQRQEAKQPILEVLRHYPREVLVAMGARLAENGAFYIYTVFVLIYGTQHVGMDRNISPDGNHGCCGAGARSDPAIRLVIGSGWASARLSLRRHHDGCARLSAVLDDGFGFPLACHAGIDPCPFGRTRRNVCAAGRVLFGVVWCASSIQRCVAGCTTLIGPCRRIVPDYCDYFPGVWLWTGRAFTLSDWDGGDHHYRGGCCDRDCPARY